MLHAKGAYTLQLMASVDLQGIKDFVLQHRLGHHAKYFHVSYQGKTWYVLTYGHYRSLTQARTALQQLPKAVQALHPWVKSAALINQEIHSRKIG